MSDELIQEIRDRYKAAKGAWTPIQEEGDVDMRHVGGDPWSSKDRRARENAKRPVIALDELSQYFNQTINDIRANPRAIKFTPKGNGATDKSAEFYANKTRDIEFQSHAQYGYVTAYENAIHRGYGWTKVVSQYADDHVSADADADPRFFYQDLKIDGVPNPNMILPDPMWKRPEMGDIGHLFETEQWRKDEFKREFGEDATGWDMSAEAAVKAGADDWVKATTILLAAYWKREKSGSRRLVLLKPTNRDDPKAEPTARWASPKEQIDAKLIHDTRMVDDYRVTSYLTNGLEILKTTPWRGRYIPFAACTGKTIYVDTGSGPERRILSMTRLARDPYKLYCYIRSLEMETMGMVTKFPYFFYEGQLSNEMLNRMARSLHEPVAGIAVKPTLPGLNPGTPLPFPERNLLAPDLQAYEVFAEAARRAIQAAMGITPLPTNAQKKNDKSGVALKQVEKSEQIGSFHFASHYDDMIRHIGLILEDLIDKIYDTDRDTSIRKVDESGQVIRINNPAGSIYNDQGQLSGDPVFTKADHIVTVSSGPAADSQREAVQDFFETLSNNEAVMARGADLIVRLAGRTGNLGPLADELADRLVPPDVRQQQQAEKQGMPDPKQLMQQVTAQQGQIQQAEQAIAQLTHEIATKHQEFVDQRVTKKMELDAKHAHELKLKQIDITEAERDRAMKIEIARIEAAKQAADTAVEAAEEHMALAHEADQAALDRHHDVVQALIGHQAATEQADQEHQQTLEQGDQAHQQTMQQAEQQHGHALEQGEQGIQGTLATQQQAADLAPEPEAGA